MNSISDNRLCKFGIFLAAVGPLANGESAPPSNDGPVPIAALVEMEERVYPFSELIEAMAGYRVFEWQGEARSELQAAADAVLASTADEAVQAKRVNEVGYAVEDRLLLSLAEAGFAVGVPLTQSGRRQSSGYPDLVARLDGQTFYIEVKTLSERNADSTFRSFYLSPTPDPKIREDAWHLLFGFVVEPDAAGGYRAVGYEVLDLSGLECALKAEFNASNRDLYGSDLTILESPSVAADSASRGSE